jgi:death-on-curing protein
VNPTFLSMDVILQIHTRLLALHGGLDGIRDPGLLDSAVAQPMATFGGEFLHEDLFAMAAAYLFHITKNHPFVDGNKRVGFVAALTFLELNGFSIAQDSPLLYDATIDVAEGRLGKEGLAELFRRLATPTG